MQIIARIITLTMLVQSLYTHAFKSPRSLRSLSLIRRMCTSTEDTGNASPADQLTELSRLEIRVGRIVEVGLHPEADNLFVGRYWSSMLPL